MSDPPEETLKNSATRQQTKEQQPGCRQTQRPTTGGQITIRVHLGPGFLRTQRTKRSHPADRCGPDTGHSCKYGMATCSPPTTPKPAHATQSAASTTTKSYCSTSICDLTDTRDPHPLHRTAAVGRAHASSTTTPSRGTTQARTPHPSVPGRLRTQPFTGAEATDIHPQQSRADARFAPRGEERFRPSQPLLLEPTS